MRLFYVLEPDEDEPILVTSHYSGPYEESMVVILADGEPESIYYYVDYLPTYVKDGYSYILENGEQNEDASIPTW